MKCTTLQPGPRRCKACNGRGKVRAFGPRVGPLEFIRDEPCTVCGGDGEVCAKCGRQWEWGGVDAAVQCGGG